MVYYYSIVLYIPSRSPAKAVTFSQILSHATDFTIEMYLASLIFSTTSLYCYSALCYFTIAVPYTSVILNCTGNTRSVNKYTFHVIP